MITNQSKKKARKSVALRLAEHFGCDRPVAGVIVVLTHFRDESSHPDCDTLWRGEGQ